MNKRNGNDPNLTAKPTPPPSYEIIDQLRSNATIRQRKPRKWRFWR